MKEYIPFADWETDYMYDIRDRLEAGFIQLTFGNEDEFVAMSITLTPTDIKRLMECVERWEAFCEVRMEVGE